MELGLNLSWFSFLQYLLLLTSLICFIKLLAPKKNKGRPPPSPPRLPIIGNFHQLTMGTSPLAHRSLQSLSQKYGPLMLVSFGSKPVVVACTVEAAREISKNHDLVFSGRPKSRIIEKLLHGAPDVAFAPYGEYWRELKSLCVLRLLSNKKVRSFNGIREEESCRMIERIREKTSSSSVVINLSEMLVTVMNDIISRIILGRRYSCDDDSNNKNNKIVRMIQGFAEVAGTANISDYIPWLVWINNFNGHNAKAEKVSKEIDEVMDEIIAEHKIKMKEEDDDTSDFVDILLDIQRKNLMTFPLEINTIKAVLIVSSHSFFFIFFSYKLLFRNLVNYSRIYIYIYMVIIRT